MTRTSINEILNFLSANAPSRLAELKSRFPDTPDVFIPDKQGVSDEATRARGEAALAAMEEVQPRAVRLLAVAMERTHAADRSEDAAAIVTTVSALVTAALALVKDLALAVRLLPALLTFLSSLWALQSKRGRRAVLAQDIAGHARTLASAAEKAKQIAADLRVFLNPGFSEDYTLSVPPLVDRANAVAEDVVKAQMDLGEFPEHALS